MDKPEFRVERGPETEPEPFAIGMAKLLEREGRTVAAAELRRLYQLVMDQQGELYALNMARSMEQKTAALKRGALLKALKMIAGEAPCIDNLMSDKDIARAAIAKAVEGENHAKNL